MVTWYNGHDHHVEHVVEEQGDADGDEHELPLVLGLLHGYGGHNEEMEEEEVDNDHFDMT